MRSHYALRLLLTALLSIPALAQQVHPLTGRPLANVMCMGGADWLERAEREREESPEDALEALELRPGMTVADVGAGVGYMTARLARRVAPGKVYATDIQPGMIERLKERIAQLGLGNVEPVLSAEDDPRLPAGAIDLILLVDVYHEFSQPQKMLEKLRLALKPDGRLVLLEYRKEDPKIPIRLEHKMSVSEVRTELEAEGFCLEKVLDQLPRQHILIFRRAPVM